MVSCTRVVSRIAERGPRTENKKDNVSFNSSYSWEKVFITSLWNMCEKEQYAGVLN